MGAPESQVFLVTSVTYCRCTTPAKQYHCAMFLRACLQGERVTLASGLKLALVYRQISQEGWPYQPGQLYMTLPALLACFVRVILSRREGNLGARVTLARGLPYLPCQRSARDNSPTRVNFPVSKKVGDLPSWSEQLGRPGTALTLGGWLRPGGQN